MPPGKMAAQAGHAFVEALRDASSNWDTDSVAHQDYITYRDERPGTKVVLVAPDEEALRRIWEYAWRFYEIPAALVFDSGHVMPPHFDGSRILTAVGLGPCTKRRAAPVTKGLALVP